MSRRDWLRVGSLGLAGISLLDLADWQKASTLATDERPGSFGPPSFGKAKSIILIHLYGSPSQLETVDPKPNAPLEIRGELGQIASNLPGLNVCELLPNLAKVMDRCTVLRSLTHPYPLHGVAFALTGVPAIDVPMELNPHDPRHWPFFGSVVEFVDGQAGQRAAPRGVPANVAMPWQFSSRRVGEVPRAGPYAAFLGGEYNPVWTDFVGTATRSLAKTLQKQVYTDNDPYIGLTPDSHFVVPSATNLQHDVTIDRLNRRRSLVEQLDQARSDLHHSAGGKQFDRYREMTFGLLESDQLRTALDVRLEAEAIRKMYGDTLFGQGCLAARRLVEAGSRVVTVFWDEFGLAGSAWDTHWNHFPRMRQELCPGFDQGWYGLISDLDQRGMLDDVLVVCTSEHGRTPQLSSANGGGRDHWSRVYSSIVAGAGICRGKVVGASDKHGGEVADRPVSPKDLLATMYHLLGINHRIMVHDHLGRPLPIVDGEVISELLS
ncbi:MAG TPA: DUF1501 domain-containing protein [Pirellulales bacterium]|nr:DUF1501 domain-containing protein [Pirellulales bacterium]